MSLVSGWWVVRDKKIIVSGPHRLLLEEDALERAARWNTLFKGATYEAISEDEGTRRHARQVRWEDSLG